jgi:hypothetical protein
MDPATLILKKTVPADIEEVREIDNNNNYKRRI